MKINIFVSLGILLLLPTSTISILFWSNVQDNENKQQTNNEQSEPITDLVIDSPLSITHSTSNQDWRCEEIDACSDRAGYEAIRALHSQLDDDDDGSIDIAESDDFLRDELNYENGYDRQNAFHRNDKYISVDELWMAWKGSEVRNWTTEELIEWLSTSVDLPQYAPIFESKEIDGTYLPRMAVNSQNIMTSVLGIKDPIHRQKLALKAMDVVLFGPTKDRNYLKDLVLTVCLVVALGGCWFALVQHRYSQTHLRRMMRDMESLQHAEDALRELQQQLDKAKQEQEIVAIEKENLEKRLAENEMSSSLVKPHSNCQSCGESGDHQVRVMELESALQEARAELQRALQSPPTRAWAPPVELQRWLQLTYELELRHHNSKKLAAEKQLAAAKEGCEKLRRKRSSLMEAFRIAHGGSIDDIDHQILQAKAALCEVTKDLQERVVRWKKIETLCGFPIVHNPGLSALEATLLKSSTNVSGSGQVVSEKMYEDQPPPYMLSAASHHTRVSPPPSYSSTRYTSATTSPAAATSLSYQDDPLTEEDDTTDPAEDGDLLEDDHIVPSAASPPAQIPHPLKETFLKDVSKTPTPPTRKINSSSNHHPHPLRSTASQQDFSLSLDLRPKLSHSESCTEIRKISPVIHSRAALAEEWADPSSPDLSSSSSTTDLSKPQKKKSLLGHLKRSRKTKAT